MKLKQLLNSCFLFLFLIFSSTGQALAADALPGGPEGGLGGVTGTSLTQLGTVFARIIYFLLGVVGAIAIIMIVIGGFRYILASGDPKAAQGAKGTITFAVIGLVIVLLSVVIINFLGNLLGVSDLNVIQIGS